ncbi:hypothetical protein GYH30_052217 [Glycine max]|uniref:Uncharacterized protein n=1 Tax=Glycine max TaxID=3847 RepID=A0A0R0EUI5_SOYBN|nr:hypothetical protein JHK87_052635 [Glycine soja]KAH1076617.1 hypothetical protein GYH30_052217 [Glycine max]
MTSILHKKEEIGNTIINGFGLHVRNVKFHTSYWIYSLSQVAQKFTSFPCLLISLTPFRNNIIVPCDPQSTEQCLTFTAITSTAG